MAKGLLVCWQVRPCRVNALGNHAFPSDIAALHLGNQGWWELHIEGVCTRTRLCQPCPYLKIQGRPSGSTDLKASKFGVCSYVVL